MKLKKFIVFLNILFMLAFSGCNDIRVDAYNPILDIRGLTLKISLIQTAYELYDVNILNSKIYTKSLYKELGKESYEHYKWLQSTYKNLDDNMIRSLKNIFSSNSQFDYLNSIINLDDNTDVNKIIDTINNDTELNLDLSLKNDINIFFNTFYNDYFKSYYNKNKFKFTQKVKNLNQVLTNCEIDINKFINDFSGIELDKNYKSTFYFSFNPVHSYELEYDNLIVSTISPDIRAQDLLSLAFHNYSHSLFTSFFNEYKFNEVYNLAKENKYILEKYEPQSTMYSFKEWYIENLVEGFSKFLDYSYCKSAYEYSIYGYDLEFYNYLKDINFNPIKMNLKEVSSNFFKEILSKK